MTRTLKARSGYIIGAALIAVSVAACATAAGRTYPVRPFTPTAIDRLVTGLPLDSVVAWFGEPDTTYQLTFGKDVGQEWQGLVVRYFTERDLSYQHYDVWSSNLFVFRVGSGVPRLNHWDITYVRPAVAGERAGAR